MKERAGTCAPTCESSMFGRIDAGNFRVERAHDGNSAFHEWDRALVPASVPPHSSVAISSRRLCGNATKLLRVVESQASSQPFNPPTSHRIE